MRPFIFSPDASAYVDPPIESLLRQIPERTMGVHDADVCLVPITRFEHFKFNPALLNLSKPWVLVDYVENGWDWNQEETMMFGQNTEKFFGDKYNEEWRKFDEFVRDHPPLMTFKRELLEKDRTETLLPIEYTSWLPEYGMDTKDEFLKRVLEISYIWSRSHEHRMDAHAAIFSNAGKFGYDVVSDYSHLERAVAENSSSLKWLSVHVPHYARIDVKDCQKVVRQSRVTIAMAGCGVKCFRHGENCSDAIMAIPVDKLAWSYPWDQSNSIRFVGAENLPEVLSNELMRPDIYELYCQAMINGQNYRYETYLRRWVMGNIEKLL